MFKKADSTLILTGENTAALVGEQESQQPAFHQCIIARPDPTFPHGSFIPPWSH
jgi:hypothetical protein